MHENKFMPQSIKFFRRKVTNIVLLSLILPKFYLNPVFLLGIFTEPLVFKKIFLQ